MNKLIAILFIFIAVFSQSDRFIEISGHSKLEEKANIVYWNLQVKSVSKELKDAKETSDKIVKSLSLKLKKHSIHKKSLVLRNTTQGKNYEYIDNKRVFTGYYYNRDFRLELKEIKKFDTVSDILTSNEMIEIHQIKYDLQNKSKLKEKAIKAAIQDAKRKAETIASELSVKISNVLQVTEEQFRQQNPRPYMMDDSMAIRNRDSGTSFSSKHLGSISISYRATVRFLIK